MPVTASLNTYATWDNIINTYTTLEAAPTYGVLGGATLQIARTLPSSGTLLCGRLRTLAVGGSLMPSGRVPKQAPRMLAGTLASAGVLLRRLPRTFVGTLNSAATGTSYGSLEANAYQDLEQYQYAQIEGGGIAGVLQLGIGRTLSGSLTSSGALTLPRTLRRAYAGVLGSSGLLTRGIGRPLSGVLGSSGVLKRGIGRTLSGVLNSSGALALRQTLLRTFTGAVTSTGVLKRQIARALAGSLTSSGVVAFRQSLLRAYTGTLASSGLVLLGKIFTRSLNGTLSSSGLVRRQVLRVLAGVLGSSGVLKRGVGRTFSGSLASSGGLAVRQTLYRAYTGTLSSSGVLLVGKSFTRSLSGVLGSSGSATLVATVRRLLAVGGSLASSGLLQLQQGIPVSTPAQFDGTLRSWGWLTLQFQEKPASSLRLSQTKTGAPSLLLAVESG